MTAIAIIGGSGVYGLPDLCPQELTRQSTPYGEVTGILKGTWPLSTDTAIKPSANQTAPLNLYFLPRHGKSHALAPHKINYRANIWALKSLGVNKILALNAVGSLFSPPGTWLLPEQIIDYTYGREHSFFDDFSQGVTHTEFTEPLHLSLINNLKHALADSELCLVQGGVYGCTQGPRLETAAEINRLERDGCSMVGMTLMPEAALAAELSIAYASLCLSVNWAAGKCSAAITLEEILQCLQQEHSRLSQYWPDIINALAATQI
ncbi:MAG TPA: S-methyl-5'-thioinosine phosphorylase [Cellvibrionaceae bacterium]|nr:S-methyl-5'-thioinosine phosphorylase [Cellvibrionaceae bacterium]HMW47609.1 S-methyl-5'-thioinosine phosphorylase [Cellvibrionaceae bacterium]HMW71171.1 S-methyl-5'-thioinosine phosphorylase [Cellvibrionaceae bacterium]HMY41037.1 S-methyl-5'-thioinosine phosphorylase [Marinagarivorans sp.]HNG61878.1 S-methyl-5'-thioinosine phosphorylase [Cellvibrionaceae bacterium]